MISDQSLPGHTDYHHSHIRFSLLRVLALLIFSLLIIFVSSLTAYWYASNQTPTQTTHPVVQSTPTIDSQKEISVETKNPETEETLDWKTYETSNLSLQYPGSWTSYKEDDQRDWVYFKSPDYVPATEQGPSVKAGYWLEVRVAKSVSYESYEEDLKNAPIGQKNHGGTYEIIKIDGNNAILSNTKTHGSYWYASTYYKDQTYFFRLNVVDEKKPEVKDLFKTILASIKLK